MITKQLFKKVSTTIYTTYKIYYYKTKHSILAGSVPAKNRKNRFLVIHLAKTSKLMRPKIGRMC